MKRPFKVTIDVMAYSQEDAQAKIDLLLQMGAFFKDFNVNNLAGSIIKTLLISKFEEIAEKKRLESLREKKKESSDNGTESSSSEGRPFCSYLY